MSSHAEYLAEEKIELVRANSDVLYALLFSPGHYGDLANWIHCIGVDHLGALGSDFQERFLVYAGQVPVMIQQYMLLFSLVRLESVRELMAQKYNDQPERWHYIKTVYLPQRLPAIIDICTVGQISMSEAVNRMAYAYVTTCGLPCIKDELEQHNREKKLSTYQQADALRNVGERNDRHLTAT